MLLRSLILECWGSHCYLFLWGVYVIYDQPIKTYPPKRERGYLSICHECFFVAKFKRRARKSHLPRHRLIFSQIFTFPLICNTPKNWRDRWKSWANRTRGTGGTTAILFLYEGNLFHTRQCVYRWVALVRRLIRF